MGIKIEQVINPKNRPDAKKDRLIKNLKQWVAVLAVADIVYTIFAFAVLWNGAIL